MTDIWKMCAGFRAAGIPIHVRQYDTLIGEPRFWVYHGYAPAIGAGLTKREALLVIKAATDVHQKLWETGLEAVA